MARQNKRNAFGLCAVFSMQIYCPFPPWDFLYSTYPAEMVIFCGCSVWIPKLEYCLYLTILVSWSYLCCNLINFLLCIYILILTQTLNTFNSIFGIFVYIGYDCVSWLFNLNSTFYDCYEILSNFSENKLLFQCFDIQSRHISWYHLGGCKPGFPVKCIRIKVSTFIYCCQCIIPYYNNVSKWSWYLIYSFIYGGLHLGIILSTIKPSIYRFFRFSPHCD